MAFRTTYPKRGLPQATPRISKPRQIVQRQTLVHKQGHDEHTVTNQQDGLR